MAFICFTLLVLPSLSNSKYLLVELNGLPDKYEDADYRNMDPGYRNMDLAMDNTTEGPETPESEEEPTDDLEPETSPEDDEEGDIPEQEQEPSNDGLRGPSLNLDLSQSLVSAELGYRSGN